MTSSTSLPPTFARAAPTQARLPPCTAGGPLQLLQVGDAPVSLASTTSRVAHHSPIQNTRATPQRACCGCEQQHRPAATAATTATSTTVDPPPFIPRRLRGQPLRRRHRLGRGGGGAACCGAVGSATLPGTPGFDDSCAHSGSPWHNRQHPARPRTPPDPPQPPATHCHSRPPQGITFAQLHWAPSIGFIDRVHCVGRPDPPQHHPGAAAATRQARQTTPPTWLA